MYELFFNKLKDTVLLSKEREELITKYLTPKRLRKKQYLLQAGDIATTLAFVEKGALRAYCTDSKGVEHIIQFALEGWTISDLYSFLSGEPATYNIDALEDCELVLISKQAQEEILKQIPEYEVYFRIQMTNAFLALQKRLTSMISLPLEQRYMDFVNLFPDVMQRVPQHMIASYMGLSPETVSRLRKKIKLRNN